MSRKPDIVERMRHGTALEQHWAAEVEGLRAEIERLKDYSAGLEDVLRRSSSSNEVERLLALLKAIERHTAPSTRTWDTCLRDMRLANDLARAALEPKP